MLVCMSDLALVSTEELVAEIHRRCRVALTCVLTNDDAVPGGLVISRSQLTWINSSVFEAVGFAQMSTHKAIINAIAREGQKD